MMCHCAKFCGSFAPPPIAESSVVFGEHLPGTLRYNSFLSRRK